jgi:methionine-R-sulfoxide reductase
MKRTQLTPQEKAVIIHKQTERPFSGQYDDFYQPGTYLCKNCQTPLYRSDAKFNARCGWPSFDQEIAGAVTHTPESDGRVEISCTHCGAHLGHVFTGEEFTQTNTRHCVNSISLTFVPQKDRL